MKYQRAGDVLPQDLIAAIQQHVDGCSLYIPRKTGQRQGWGVLSGAKDEISRRNALIRAEHERGLSVDQLVDRHHLSSETIRKIVYKRV